MPTATDFDIIAAQLDGAADDVERPSTRRTSSRFPTMRSRSEALAVAALLVGAVVSASCGNDDADETTTAWCQQFDAVLTEFSTFIEANPDADLGDPALADEIASIEEGFDQLNAMEVPDALRDDWEAAAFFEQNGSGVVTEPEAAAPEARRRVGQWVLEECSLSPVAESTIRADLDS
jgi:hypothetical protein